MRDSLETFLTYSSMMTFCQGYNINKKWLLTNVCNHIQNTGDYDSCFIYCKTDGLFYKLCFSVKNKQFEQMKLPTTNDT